MQQNILDPIMEDIVLSERNQKVVRSANLIQKAQYTLTLQEQRFLLYTISKVKPDDSIDTEYEIELKDYLAVCGMHGTTSYANIKNIIHNVFQQMCLTFEDEEGTWVITGWYDYIKVRPGDGTATFKLGSLVAKHLIGLAAYNAKASSDERIYYISDELKYMLPYTSRYSYYLYPLLQSYSNNTEWTFTLETLRERLDVFERTENPRKDLKQEYKNNRKALYPRYVDLKRNVLDPAVDDINRYSNIKCVYIPIKKGRSVHAIRFIFEAKQPDELRDAEYRGRCVLDKNGIISPKPVPSPLPFFESSTYGVETIPPSYTVSKAEKEKRAKESKNGTIKYKDIQKKLAESMSFYSQPKEEINLGKRASRKKKPPEINFMALLKIEDFDDGKKTVISITAEKIRTYGIVLGLDPATPLSPIQFEKMIEKGLIINRKANAIGLIKKKVISSDADENSLQLTILGTKKDVYILKQALESIFTYKERSLAAHKQMMQANS